VIAEVGILGTGLYAPERVRDNVEIEAEFGLDAGWIESKVGVLERRAVATGEATSDLAVGAAADALWRAKVRPAEIGLIVVATSTPDLPVSSTAAIVQGRIGAGDAGAIDVNGACAGFVYALTMAAGLLAIRGDDMKALVIGAETMSSILDTSDRATAVLFGDGAGAAVLGKVEKPYGILGYDLRADGRAWDLVHMPCGGSRRPSTHETVDDHGHVLKMNGRGVASFFAERTPAGLEQVAASCGLGLDEVDVLVPHQANGVLLRQCLGEAGFGDDRVCYTLDRFGNTGSASVAITLADADRGGRFSDGDLVMLFGIGAGMTWGGLVTRWQNAS